jgi:hypothetical protein
MGSCHLTEYKKVNNLERCTMKISNVKEVIEINEIITRLKNCLECLESKNINDHLALKGSGNFSRVTIPLRPDNKLYFRMKPQIELTIREYIDDLRELGVEYDHFDKAD